MESLPKAFGVSASLLAGYIFLRISTIRRLRAEHLRTDRFALHIFGFSIICYIGGVMMSSIIAYRFPQGFADTYLGKAAKYAELEIPVLCALALAPLLGLVDRAIVLVRMNADPFVQQVPWRRFLAKSEVAASALFIGRCNDEAIKMLYRATFYRKPVMLTLRSGKVYVGVPVGMGDPSMQMNFIKIVPVLSGYRDSETHQVTFSTRYRDITSQVVPRRSEPPPKIYSPLDKDVADLRLNDSHTVEIDLQDMGIVILWPEIAVLSLYDENIYQAFQAAGPPAGKPDSVLEKLRALISVFIS